MVFLIRFKVRKMKEEDIETVYKNLHLDFVNKYFKSIEKQKEVHKNHDKWYRSHLSSEEYLIYIFENDSDEFVGLTSYQLLEDKALVSIYVNKDFRGKKYSKSILDLGILEFLTYNKKNIEKIQANILEENSISKKIFIDLGFTLQNEVEIGKDGLEYQVFIKYL